MTAIGRRAAVVSLGLSCQTAFQVRRHAPLLRSLLDDELRVVRSPFDWMIVPLLSSAAMIAAGEFFPRSMAELDWCRHPYWRRYDCFFWHDDDVFDNPGRFIGRFAASSANLERLHAVPRRIFIVSNGQNSLPHLASSVGGLPIRFTDGGVAALADAIEARWGASELYLLGCSSLNECKNRSGFAALTPDDTVWEGHDGQWRDILSAIAIGAIPPYERRPH